LRTFSANAFGKIWPARTISRFTLSLRLATTLPQPFSDANSSLLRIRIVQVKSVPHVPVSHPFVERMIRTIREELLDQVLFWNQLDLERTLAVFRIYYNKHRVHSGIDGIPPEQEQEQGQHRTLPLTEFRWMSHCQGLFQLPAAA
jgi:putative transposase